MYSKKLGKFRILLIVPLSFCLLLVSCGKVQKASYTPTDEDYTLHTTQDWPTYIDPAVGNDESDCVALVNLYDALVFPTAQGTVLPSLAEKWDISKDNLTYTFTLRQGVKFHNGDELTAEDVAFSMKRLVTIGEGFAYIFVPYVQDCKAIDKYTLRITLKKTFGAFIDALIRVYVLDEKVVMEHIKKPGSYGAFGDYGKEWLLTNDAGSGPYKVQSYNIVSELIGEKFNDYWGGWDPDAPKFFNESATTQPASELVAFASRRLEITDEIQPVETYQSMAKISGASLVTYLDGNSFSLMLHTRKAPTDDIHFRKALAYCYDYDEGATFWPGSVVAKGPVASAIPGHDPNVFQYHKDLAKAKSELALSKYADKLDQYPITLSWAAEAPAEEKIALLFQADAAAIGIKVEITKKPFGSMIADATSQKTTPNISVVMVAPQYADAGAILTTRYSSASAGTWEQCEWLLNPEIDKMISDAVSTIDQQERFKKCYAIQEKIVDLCPTIYLFDMGETRAYQSAYVDWPAADAVKSGTSYVPIIGYERYFHNMKVYPQKRADLLSTP